MDRGERRRFRGREDTPAVDGGVLVEWAVVEALYHRTIETTDEYRAVDDVSTFCVITSARQDLQNYDCGSTRGVEQEGRAYSQVCNSQAP